MEVRYPKFDFSGVRPHWSPAWEFAQQYNAGSTVPAHIEPYLVKVMIKAKPLLPADQIRLHGELDIFIKQEMQHCKMHLNFNKLLHRAGYDGMIAMEREYAADYARFLAEKSLRFNLAYCEGFEAMSAIAVTAFFEDFDAFLEGADPEAVDLWKWHLAEEFEHRTVAHDMYHALSGLPGVLAYFYRLYGFFYAVRHINRHTQRVARYLIAKDREGMTGEQLAQSKAREKAARRALNRSAWMHLRAILSPFYRPAGRPVPKGLPEFLDRFDAKPAPAG